MVDPGSPHQLSNRNINLCEYGGGFGVLLSLTCLVQHFAVAIPNRVTNPMIPIYLFAILAFLLLAFQRIYSMVLLIGSAVLSFIAEFLWMTHAAFSFVVLALFIYHVIIIVVLYTEQVPQHLKQKKLAEKKEEEFWSDKL